MWATDLVSGHSPSPHNHCQDTEYNGEYKRYATNNDTSDPASSPVVVVVVVIVAIIILQQLAPSRAGIRLNGGSCLQVKRQSQLPVILQ